MQMHGYSLHLESGKRVAFVMHMRSSISTILVICATIGASVIAPERAMAARPQQIFTIVTALDSVPPAAKASGAALPNGDAAKPFGSATSASQMGARARAKLT